MVFSLVLFWSFTALNCAGVRISTKVSTWCSVLGIIIPMNPYLAGKFGAHRQHSLATLAHRALHRLLLKIELFQLN